LYFVLPILPPHLSPGAIYLKRKRGFGIDTMDFINMVSISTTVDKYIKQMPSMKRIQPAIVGIVALN